MVVHITRRHQPDRGVDTGHLKDAGPRLLVEAVRAAAAGDALVSLSVTVRLLRHLAGPARSAARDLAQPLSERELQVVRAVARGRTNVEIGGELFISLSTVKRTSPRYKASWVPAAVSNSPRGPGSPG